MLDVHTHTYTHAHKPKLPIYFLFFLLLQRGSVSLSPRSPPPSTKPRDLSTVDVLLRPVLIFAINSPSSPNLFSLVAPSLLHLQYCYASHLTCRHSAAVPLHPLGLCSSIPVKHVCVWVCAHMCMYVFCPCALRSPSWTGCLAIINLCQHLKSHLR